ncbi:MAG TPA: zf-HC2 domain-containing protein [Candidatus Sulfopaludibacter sp.]|nr:zf-HC2 domain-containing protein [Candidatus Sulfopaludibacter sp.]
MNNVTRHPEDGQLLRYVDGELPARKARQVEKHLQACWQCRTEIEELKSTVAECIRYRKYVLGVHLPIPPNPWADLSREFARIDDSVSAEPFFARILRPMASLRWSLAAAAAIALVCTVVYQLRETPSVQAATLLKRAVAATATQPVKPVRHIRFRTSSQQFVRNVAAGRNLAALPANLEARFQQARYDSADPLSAHAFQTWRDEQPQKQDEVSTVPDPQTHDGNCYRLHTTTATGDVAAATLMLRTTDLAPVEGLLEFRDNQWIEFSEFTESPNRSSDTSTASVETPERLAEPPSRLAAGTPRKSVSVSDELQVLSALHQIGADLGDPIQVSRTSDEITVSGVGVSPQRRQLIQRKLESMPNVAVQFSEPGAVTLPEVSSSTAPAASGTARSSAPNSKIQTRLEEQLGGRAELERFSSQILDVNEDVMSRARALRKLAQRFQPSDETQMTAEDRRVLKEMALEHVTAISGTVQTLQHALNPVMTSLGGSAARHSASQAASWQASSEDLVRASLRLQMRISVLLGVAAGQNSADLPSDVLNAVSDLRADLDRCQQLLAQEGGG